MKKLTKNQPSQATASSKPVVNHLQNHLQALRAMTSTIPTSKTTVLPPRSVKPRAAAKPSIEMSNSKRPSQNNTSGSSGPVFDLSAANAKQQQSQQQQPSNRQPSGLQQEFEKKMQGAQFRVLNEEMYTSNSKHAFDMMTAQPELFEIYHDGFRSQVEKWPANPVDLIIAKIVEHHINAKHTSSTTIADIGCGDSKIALTFGKHVEVGTAAWPAGHPAVITSPSQTSMKDMVVARGKNVSVYSLDLVSSDCYSLPLGKPNSQEMHSVITPTDAAALPLPDQSVDCAVFCLSLMGVNYKDFLTEAHRIIRPSKPVQGNLVPSLYIAEVRSRFDEQGTKKQNGGKAGKIVYKQFISFVESLGFKCLKYDTSNTMFVMMEFARLPNKTNSSSSSSPVADFALAPCIYKRR